MMNSILSKVLLAALFLSIFVTFSVCDDIDIWQNHERSQSYFTLDFHRARFLGYDYIDAFYLQTDDIVIEVSGPPNSSEKFQWYVNSAPYEGWNNKNVLYINIQDYKMKFKEYPRKIGVKSDNYYSRKFVFVVEIPAEFPSSTICLFPDGASPTSAVISTNNCIIGSSDPPKFDADSLSKKLAYCALPPNHGTIEYLHQGMGGTFKTRLGRINSEGKVVERIGRGPWIDFYTPAVEFISLIESYVCLFMSEDETFERVISKPLSVLVRPLTTSTEDRLKSINDLLFNFETQSIINCIQHYHHVPLELVNAAALLKTITRSGQTEKVAETFLRLILADLRCQAAYSSLGGMFSSYLDILSVNVHHMSASPITVGYVTEILAFISSITPMLQSEFEKLIPIALKVQENLINSDPANDKLMKIIYDTTAARLLTNGIPYPPQVILETTSTKVYATLSYDTPLAVVFEDINLAPAGVSLRQGPYFSIVSSSKLQKGVLKSTSQLNGPQPLTQVLKYSCQNASNQSCAQDIMISPQTQKSFIADKLLNNGSIVCAKVNQAAKCPITSGINTYRVSFSTDEPNGGNDDDDASDASDFNDSVMTTRTYIKIIVFIIVLTCFIFFVVLITVKLVLCIRNRRRAQNTNAREPTYEVEVQADRSKTTVSIRCAKTPNPSKTNFQLESPVKKCQTPSANQSNPYY